MSQAHQLANKFREVLLNGTWIANTNFKKQLADVTYEEATTKISSLNTIALLAFHINYYIEGLLDFFETGKLEIRDKYSFDMQPIESEEDWKSLIEALICNAEAFARNIENLPDEKLSAVFIDEKYGDYQRNINGMIEHAYYHLGQLSLIKKLIRERKTA